MMADKPKLPKQSRLPGSMTPDEFRLALRLWPHSPAEYTIERARRVLVDGQSISAVAKANGVREELIYKTIRKIRTALF